MASGSSGEVITIPRNFKLLEELEKAEKGNTEMTVSYGLVDSEDMSLSAWQCTILGAPGSSLENRIVSCLVHCSPNYPTAQPDVKFQSKLNFPFIGADGKFDYKLGKLQWSREKSIESVLVYLRQLLAKGEYKKLPQPADGTTYN